MTMKELAAEYRISGEKCRCRVQELRQQLNTEEMSETQRLLLRRRINMLSAMCREAITISLYLERRYGKENADEAGEGSGL